MKSLHKKQHYYSLSPREINIYMQAILPMKLIFFLVVLNIYTNMFMCIVNSRLSKKYVYKIFTTIDNWQHFQGSSSIGMNRENFLNWHCTTRSLNRCQRFPVARAYCIEPVLLGGDCPGETERGTKRYGIILDATITDRYEAPTWGWKVIPHGRLISNYSESSAECSKNKRADEPRVIGKWWK